MLWGLGAWATLPSVIGGYIGNPFATQTWIEDAMVTNTKFNRFPTNAIDIIDGEVINKFAELPGGFKRRPLELATLRLQNMLGISLQHWEALKPSKEALDAGVLTQLGALIVLDKDGMIQYEWKDQGICHVCNFEDMISKISLK